MAISSECRLRKSFVDVFLPRNNEGEWKNLNERDPGEENKIQEYSEGRNPSRESGQAKCYPSGKGYPSAICRGIFN